MRWCDRGEVGKEREETWEGDKHGRERKELIKKNDSNVLQCGLKNKSAL